MGKVIAHIDLNAFFAAAEVIKNPTLAGKPVVIGQNSYKSIVSTASYEARKFGIHSAMPMHQAKSLCPKVIIVEPDFNYYVQLSNRFFALLKEFTPVVEITSIDEGFLDLTEVINGKKPIAFLKSIKKRIYEDLKLTCSIGVASNKFLAKMASEMQKPDGLTILRKKDIPTRLWVLPIGQMYGIGKKSAPRLIELGINTIGDLANCSNPHLLRPVLGKLTESYIRHANGKANDKVVVEDEDRKSIGNSTTLLENTTDINLLATILSDLVDTVVRRAKRSGMIGLTVTVNLKFYDFSVRSKQMQMEKYSDEKEDIFSYAQILLEKAYDGRAVRLVGATLGSLKHKEDKSWQIDFASYRHEEIIERKKKNGKNT